MEPQQSQSQRAWASRLWRALNPRRRPLPRFLDDDLERRLEAIELRLEHLERAHEGLQDAIHRRAVLEDENMDDLRRRTRPEQIARDLSEDARRRGL